MASPSINTLRRMSICKSPAWKDTQRILKRSGLVYRGERSESFDPEKHFNRYTVRYLYLLNMIALELREDTRIKVEVGHWYRMTGKRLSLNVPPFMLIPRNIRRKVDGFRQSEGEATKQTAQPFTGSLYEVLSRDIDSAKLDAWIAGLSLSALEGAKEISIMGFSPWAVAKSVRQSASPTFELFYQEYQSLVLKSVFKLEPGFEQLLTRLSFIKQSILSKQQYRVKSQLLERLGNVLFFTLLYNQGCPGEFINTLVEKEDIYLKASPGEEKVKAHQKLINYIEEFCNKMMEKYLISAARRHYQKKKIARSRSGES
ncbi:MULTISPECIES: hypothetical protein [Enterobacteriaceae]|uniref:hypothetical protein n=1 Tax=Enterobacteriaceae TaxID=543 RepID=UPI0004A04D5C|nr:MULTISPECIES: hypothetical protein [Enterobacteriaceae]EEV0950186.1 hypothetical protein [Escherichia coli]EFB1086736.1 hypothetical protein [Escherichia coli]EFB1927474.1 hypothetical protein [Escherichia coli]EFB2682131.1 hypothetical protein [Escherichia coli]EFB6233855.1 hypothetical protein [Escherichia coli]